MRQFYQVQLPARFGCSLRESKRPDQAKILFRILPIAIFVAQVCQGAVGAESFGGLAGSWELSWVRFGETNVDRIRLESSGSRITGKGLGGLIVDGTASDGKLKLSF